MDSGNSRKSGKCSFPLSLPQSNENEEQEVADSAQSSQQRIDSDNNQEQESEHEHESEQDSNMELAEAENTESLSTNCFDPFSFAYEDSSCTLIRSWPLVRSAFASMLQDLRSHDLTAQIIAMERFSQQVAVLDEERIVRAMKIDEFCNELFSILLGGGDYGPSLACRCLYNLLSISRAAIRHVAYNGGVSILSATLTSSEFMETLEQAIYVKYFIDNF